VRWTWAQFLAEVDAFGAGLAALGLGSAAPRLPLVELEPGPALNRVRETLAALAPLASAA